jgi:hypothetical protein
MPSWLRPCASFSIVTVTIFLPATARAESCDQLWQARNHIFAEAGHCFKSPRAIAVFGARCYPPYGRLRSAQEARVNSIIAQERRQGCSGDSDAAASGSDARLPSPDPQGGSGADNQLNEAASVWTATQGSNSPAVLEAYIERFGGTPFGDLARARLEEVKKTSAAATPPAASGAPAPTGETEMCPKYLPSVGRTVQAPCETYQQRAN